MAEPVSMAGIAFASGAGGVGVGGYLLKMFFQRWMNEQDKFRDEVEKEMRAVRVELQTHRTYVDAENQRLREIWHGEASRMSGVVGQALQLSMQNEKAIDKLITEDGRIREVVHRVEVASSETSGSVKGLTVAVEALTAAFTRNQSKE